MCFYGKSFWYKKGKASEIPEVTHVDGTGRLQSVNKDISLDFIGWFLNLKQSGVPILLNTSFNENEPIVNKPKESVRLFPKN